MGEMRKEFASVFGKHRDATAVVNRLNPFILHQTVILGLVLMVDYK